MQFLVGDRVRHIDMPKLRNGVVVGTFADRFVGVTFPGDTSPGLYCIAALALEGDREEPDSPPPTPPARLSFRRSWIALHPWG